MNLEDYPKWFDFHCTHFQGVKIYYEQLPEKGRQGLDAAWYGVLKNVPLAECEKATKNLFSTPSSHPHKIEKFPGLIAQLAREGSESKVQHDWIKCKKCQDIGFITVKLFGRHLKKAYRIYGEECPFIKDMTCAVACNDCAKGRARESAGVESYSDDMHRVDCELQESMPKEKIRENARYISQNLFNVGVEKTKEPLPVW